MANQDETPGEGESLLHLILRVVETIDGTNDLAAELGEMRNRDGLAFLEIGVLTFVVVGRPGGVATNCHVGVPILIVPSLCQVLARAILVIRVIGSLMILVRAEILLARLAAVAPLRSIESIAF